MLQTMQQRVRAARENEKGFTLIELLIVIVILGVLAGVVVLSINAIQDKGQTAACKTDLKTVQSAAEAYYANVGNYPTAIDDAAHTATTMVGANVLKSAPGTTDSITYTQTGGGTGYTLVSGLAGCTL